VEAAEVLRRKGYRGPVTILPAGIDPHVYNATPAVLTRTPGEVVLGFVGRIAEEKGLSTMLRALKLIESLPWRLVVVGTGPYDAVFDAETARLGLLDRIERRGYVPHTEAPAYLAALDVLLLPSETRPNWKEQFGRVLVEAMACGTPVIGSDSGEIPHVIAATGGGLVFPEGEARALAQCIEALVTDPARRRAIGAAGRAHVRLRYTNDALARRFAESMVEAMATRRLATAPSTV
jgi:glycosyltransferase involved in cell wall biosynthesis